MATGLIERLRAQGYSFCIIDPEGDYDELEDAVVLGSPDARRRSTSACSCWASPTRTRVINLLGIEAQRPAAFFMTLFARIRDLRAQTGRPHWLIVDEAHHVMPADWQPTELALPERLDGVLLVSVTPASIAPTALRLVDTLIVLGDKPREMLREFAEANEIGAAVELPRRTLERARRWSGTRRQARPPLCRARAQPHRARRHLRKYAEGELREDRSFYFRGPRRKTESARAEPHRVHGSGRWRRRGHLAFHLRSGRNLRWLRGGIKDENLAGQRRGDRARERRTQLPRANRCASSSKSAIRCRRNKQRRLL